MEYVIKHINTNNLRHTNVFVKYYSDIDLKHCVYNIDEATRFATKRSAKSIIRKFKHPDLWEIMEVKVYEKRR